MKTSLDSRLACRRKWRVDCESGPLVLLAELLKKKLRAHGWPVDYRICGDFIRFIADDKASLGDDFDDALPLAVAIIGSDYRLDIGCEARQAWFEQEHYVDLRRKPGVLRVGIMPPPF